MKTIILHLGTHKAASTSVQVFLANNREALSKLGICYPRPPPPTDFAHHGLAWTIISQYTSLERRPANYTLDDALEELGDSGCDTLFLSSEDFLTCTFYEGFLDEFFTTLRQTFDRVVVCAYVRSRKDFFASSYNQWVKSLSYSKDFETYFTGVQTGQYAPMQYTRALAAWGNKADEAVYLPFLTSAFELSAERHLLAELNVSTKDLATLKTFSSEALNTSVGPLSILAFRRLVAKLESADWYNHFDLPRREALLRTLEADAQKRGWNSERFKAFDTRRLEKMKLTFHSDDQNFARQYFNRDWDSVFPGDSIADVVTERQYENLDKSERRAIDDFVAKGWLKSREIYLGELPSPGLFDWVKRAFGYAGRRLKTLVQRHP